MRKLFLLSLVLFSFSVQAARLGRVVIADTPVYKSPDSDSEVLKTLSRGVPLAVSNLPVEGFYKVRTPTEIIGWISGDAVVIYDSEQAFRGSSVRKDDLEIPQEEKEKDDSLGANRPIKGKSTAKRTTPSKFRFSFLAGGSYFNPRGLNDLIGVQVDGGNYVGFAGHVKTLKWLFPGVRIEPLFKGAATTLVDPTTTTSGLYRIDISSLSVTAGPDFRVMGSNTWEWLMGIYGGAGLFTQVKATALEEATPNETIFTQTTWTFLLRTEFRWQPTDAFSFFVEGGYRHLSADGMTASTTGNGNGVFTQNGEMQSFDLTLTGFFGGIGATYHF